jgi:hypothetical protein
MPKILSQSCYCHLIQRAFNFIFLGGFPISLGGVGELFEGVQNIVFWGGGRPIPLLRLWQKNLRSKIAALQN